MEKEINNNGYDYVDLGLPSGTLWATKNVGANKPSDFGLYFQWGDTVGYTKEQVGKDKQFTWKSYKWNPSDDSDYKFGIHPNYTKYTTKGATLELEDDAAHVNMGGSWHMPTPDQIQELIDNTTSTWLESSDVNGRLFTSKKDASKSIFIPATGVALDGSIILSGKYGYVWSANLYMRGAYGSQCLIFGSEDSGLDGESRFYGLPVRGVIG